MLKADAYKRRMEWQYALSTVAHELGKDAPLYKILGSVAWGRYDGEPSGTDGKDAAVYGAGYLAGVRYAALQAARLYNLKGERELANIHERIKARTAQPVHQEPAGE